MPQRRDADDARWMARALAIAERGRGRVEPNPVVGCVLVKAGRVIGEGYHRRFGGPHAEIEALRRCDGSPRGATAYVTLEPCCHHGKTPPCTEALISAPVGRVVAAILDPNPLVAGKGLAALRAAGIETTLGVGADVATVQNGPFRKLMSQRRPWVTLKWAQSLDGRIATHTGDSKWISDDAARRHAHRTRGKVDAILVGVNTVKTDDPALTCRVGRPARIATRIVLDRTLRLPLAASLVRTADAAPTLIVCDRATLKQRAGAQRCKRLERAGVEVIGLRSKASGVSLTALLDELGRRQMSNLLVEGGGAVLGQFIEQRLADAFHVYVAPILIGGRDATPAIGGRGATTVSDALQLVPTRNWRRLGTTWLLEARAT